MSSSRKWLRRTAVALLGIGLVAAIPMFARGASASVAGGVNTTVLTASLCLNGSQINCNNYGSKADVYLSGNPSQLTAGTYFFAVVDPGGQPNPNDGAPKNLSSVCDAYTNREFTVGSAGQITYIGTPGTHLTGTIPYGGHGKNAVTNTAIQVGDPTNGCYFANTANPGGVYILAVCLLPANYDPVTNPVDPSSCKYDAFKVKQSSTTLSYVLSGYKFLDPDLDAAVDGDKNEPGLQGWTINVSNNANSSVQSVQTDPTGYWTVSGDLPAGATSLTLTICEKLQPNWQQTGPLNTNSVDPMGAASLLTTSTSPTGNCYQVVVSSSGNSAVAGLDFFNTETTPPYCALTASGIDSTGAAYIQVTVQDSQSGLKSVQVTELNNATATWDNASPPNLSLNGYAPLIAGDTSAHTVTATKIDQTQGANLGLEVIDQAGNVTDCDPVQMAAIRSAGQPASQSIDGVQQSDHLLHVFNGNPGVTSLVVSINGQVFQFNGLRSGQNVTIDVASALQAGTNTVSLTAKGQPGGTASVLFGNI